jgi:hypothetical protein
MRFLAEVLPLRHLWYIRVSIEPIPAYPFELFAKGFFHEVAVPVA